MARCSGEVNQGTVSERAGRRGGLQRGREWEEVTALIYQLTPHLSRALTATAAFRRVWEIAEVRRPFVQRDS